jgi:CheY-like chemotaxis protein
VKGTKRLFNFKRQRSNSRGEINKVVPGIQSSPQSFPIIAPDDNSGHKHPPTFLSTQSSTAPFTGRHPIKQNSENGHPTKHSELFIQDDDGKTDGDPRCELEEYLKPVSAEDRAAILLIQSQASKRRTYDAAHLDQILAVGNTLNVPLFSPSCLQSAHIGGLNSLHSSYHIGITELDKSLENVRVLLVDDSALSLKMCGKLFRRMGAIVEDALDGAIAVEKIQARMHSTEPNYDMIVMDYMMPKMNGPTACKKMRDLGYAGLIIGLTGNALAVDIEKYLEHGADAVLKKPLDLSEFRSILLSSRLSVPALRVLQELSDYCSTSDYQLCPSSERGI